MGKEKPEQALGQLVCFDTPILIRGVQGNSKGDPSGKLVEKTKAYIAYLAEGKAKIMIPAPALYEYLSGFTEKEMQAELRKIQDHFMITAFDIAAAARAAELTNKKAISDGVAAGNSRQTVKVDTMILGSAIANKAAVVITTNPHMKNLAQGKIRVEEVPSLPSQQQALQLAEK